MPPAGGQSRVGLRFALYECLVAVVGKDVYKESQIECKHVALADADGWCVARWGCELARTLDNREEGDAIQIPDASNVRS